MTGEKPAPEDVAAAVPLRAIRTKKLAHPDVRRVVPQAADQTPVSTVIFMAINQIARDGQFQVRNKLNDLTVKRYENNYRSGRDMPPVKIAQVGDVPILADGWHRVQALENLGETHVQAEVHTATREEARWMAGSANLSHGLPLKQGELRNVFRFYIKSKQHVLPKGKLKSYRDIAADLGKPHGTIYNWMKRDFPRIAAKLGGSVGGAGGLPEMPEEDTRSQVAAAMESISALTTAFTTTSDAHVRGKIIETVEQLLSEMKGSGNWSPNEY